jgi:hypothetical protein
VGGAGHGEQRQLEQHEGGDSVGLIEGQLSGDGGAAGVAGDVSPGDAQMIEQGGGVGSVVGNADRLGRVCVLETEAPVSTREA